MRLTSRGSTCVIALNTFLNAKMGSFFAAAESGAVKHRLATDVRDWDSRGFEELDRSELRTTSGSAEEERTFSLSF